MTLWQRAISLGLVAWLAGLVGCSSASNEPSQQRSTPASESGASSTATENNVDGGHALREALPVRDWTELTSPRSTADMSFGAGVLSFDSEGTALVGLHEGAGSELLRQGVLALGPGNGQLRLIARDLARPPARQVSGGYLNKQFAVWTETPSTSLSVDPWVMYAYNRGTGTSAVIRRAPFLAGHAPPRTVGFTSVVGDGNRIAWAEFSGSPRRPRSNIMTCLIKNCRPELVIHHAAYPTVHDGHVFGLGEGKVSSDASTRDFPLRSWSRGGADTAGVISVPATRRLTGFAFDGRMTVWADAANDGVGRPRIHVQSSGQLVSLEGRADQTFGSVWISGGAVVFANVHGTSKPASVAYLPARGSMFTLGTQPGFYGVAGAHGYVAWQQGPSWRIAHLG